MKVSLAVSTYNSDSTIVSCVESLIATDYSDKEIIIIDDGSTDKTLEILKGYPVKVIPQNHQGVSAGRDLALRNASGEYILYTDSDCEVDRHWVREMLKPFENNDIGAVTGRTIFRTDSRCTSWIRSLDIEDRYSRRKTYTELANGTNCAFPRRLLLETGGFDPNWFHAEDTEVSYRILQKNYRIYYQPSAIVRHVPEGNWRSYLRKRYRGTRAHLRMMPKYAKDVVSDDFVSRKMLFQPVAYTLAVGFCILAVLGGILGRLGWSLAFTLEAWALGVGIACYLSGLVAEIPLVLKVMEKSHRWDYLWKSLMLLSAKGLMIGLGVLIGIWQNRWSFVKRVLGIIGIMK